MNELLWTMMLCGLLIVGYFGVPYLLGAASQPLIFGTNGVFVLALGCFLLGMAIVWAVDARIRSYSGLRVSWDIGRECVQSLSFATTVMTGLMIVCALHNSYYSGLGATTGEARAYYQVQLWARNTTKPDAAFIQVGASIYESWRSFSRRPLVAPFEVGSTYFYPIAAWKYREQLIQFLSQYCDFTSEQFRRHGGCYDCYKTLSEGGIVAFSKHFGADFLVRRKSTRRLKLPIAYENEHYVVYQVGHLQNSPGNDG